MTTVDTHALELTGGRATAQAGGHDGAAMVGCTAVAVWSALRMALFVIAGALPVLSISAHVFGIVAINVAARSVVLPVVVLALLVAMRPSPEATLARRGLLAGLIAVTLYDATRLPFVLTGIWPDFIPRVGGWVARSDEPHAVLGYGWRYVGNGGGIAVFFVFACAALGRRRQLVRLGVAYGVIVWSGLMATVMLADRGQALLFAITPLSVMVSLVGHLVYGSMLGWVYARMLRRDPDINRLMAAEVSREAWLRYAKRRRTNPRRRAPLALRPVGQVQ